MRASPSMSPRLRTAKPAASAVRALSARAARDDMITRFSTRAKRESPGLGVSERGSESQSRTADGTTMRYFSRISSACALVVGSAAVGPDATRAGSSPGTSEMISATTFAGCAANARRPPLIADRCLRTQLISEMGAPLASSARVTFCLSSRLIPGAGNVSSEDPPPEISANTRSSGVRPCTSARMRWPHPDRRDRASGWPASTISIAAARGAMTIARDDKSGEVASPVFFDGLGHGGGGFARAHDDGAPAGARRQIAAARNARATRQRRRRANSRRRKPRGSRSTARLVRDFDFVIGEPFENFHQRGIVEPAFACRK